MSDTSNNFADVLCVSPLSMNPISGRRLREVHATFRPRPYLAWKLSRPESLRPTRIRMSPDRRGRRLRRSRRSCPCRRTPSATPLKIQICTLLSQKATSLGVGHFRHLGIGKLYFLAIFGQWILGIQFFTTGWHICWRCWVALTQRSTEASFCRFCRIRCSCRIKSRSFYRIQKLLFMQKLLLKPEHLF